jgi:hypothetical protein
VLVPIVSDEQRSCSLNPEALLHGSTQLPANMTPWRTLTKNAVWHSTILKHFRLDRVNDNSKIFRTVVQKMLSWTEQFIKTLKKLFDVWLHFVNLSYCPNNCSEYTPALWNFRVNFKIFTAIPSYSTICGLNCSTLVNWKIVEKNNNILSTV